MWWHNRVVSLHRRSSYGPLPPRLFVRFDLMMFTRPACDVDGRRMHQVVHDVIMNNLALPDHREDAYVIRHMYKVSQLKFCSWIYYLAQCSFPAWYSPSTSHKASD